MKFGIAARTASVVGAAAVAALLASAAPAAAQPAPPVVPAPAPAPLPAPPAPPGPLSAPVQPLAGPADPVDPALAGVPHLASPENLPPGTTETPTQQTRLGYLRDLWHAMQTQEVSGGDALLLLAQRPMSATPAGGLPPGPQPAAAPMPADIPPAP